uniref:Uncharacterized protein n=1 Tax=Anguilla anguilla TaxID=7936 RepID=A0A0E9SU08_ANGAN
MHLNMLYNFTIGTTYVRHIVCPPFRPFSWGWKFSPLNV